MSLKEFLKHAYDRFTSPTPDFWKSAQRKLLRLGVMFVAIGAAYEAVPDGMLPEWILTAITYAGFACGVGVAVAQFASDDVKNPPAV